MVPDRENGVDSYIERAILSMNEIMSNNRFDAIEKMNRAHKGELFVLQYLSMRSEAVVPSELSAALRSSTGRISALLGTLEKKEQIERNIDRNNRRNILVTITQPGRERVRTELEKMKNSMARTFEEMGEADTIEFIRLARRFFVISQKHMNRTADDESGGDDG